MSQPNDLVSLGKQRLELIGKYAGGLIDGYVNGQIDEASFSVQALEKLIAARILWRPEEQESLCLRPAVNELIASLTQDERKRQINADVQDHIDHIRTRVDSIGGARRKGDYAAAEYHVQLLTERVHDMTGQFAEAIESLWYRLNTEFGFVSSLDDKIREIELAQKQLRRLLDGFNIIDFDEFIDLAGSDGVLRKLLVSQLQITISDLSGSLLEVQKRLVHLMARFRSQAERALLVTKMGAFLRQHPKFQVGDYANRSQVPAVINQSSPINAHASVALDRSQDLSILANIANSIARPRSVASNTDTQQEHFSIEDMQITEAKQKQLVTDAENFFIQAIEHQSALSALDYLTKSDLEWDPEVWLFQVIAEYEGMPASEKHSFKVEKDRAQKSVFNHLHVVRDVKVSITFF